VVDFFTNNGWQGWVALTIAIAATIWGVYCWADKLRTCVAGTASKRFWVVFGLPISLALAYLAAVVAVVVLMVAFYVLIAIAAIALVVWVFSESGGGAGGAVSNEVSQSVDDAAKRSPYDGSPSRPYHFKLDD